MRSAMARAHASPRLQSLKEISSLLSPRRSLNSPFAAFRRRASAVGVVFATTLVTMRGPRRGPKPFSSIPTEIIGTVDSVDLTKSPPTLSVVGKDYTLDKVKRVVNPVSGGLAGLLSAGNPSFISGAPWSR